MKRMYLTISLGILIALVLSSIAASQVLRLTIDEDIHRHMIKRMHSEVTLIEQQLRDVSAEQLDETLTQLQDVTFSPLEVVDLDDAKVPDDVRQELQQRREGNWHPPRPPEMSLDMNAPPPFDFEHAGQSDDTRRMRKRREHRGPGPHRRGGPHMRHVMRHSKEGMIFYIPAANNTMVAIFGPLKRPLPFELTHLLLVLAVVLPIVGLSGFALTYPVAKRLRALEKATVALGEGDLGARAEIGHGGPVGMLAQQFNEMAEKIQVLLDSHRHLLQAVAHELRTPISRISFNLEMLNDAKSENERVQRIAEIDNELIELNDLVGELLLYTRFETISEPVKKQSVNLMEVLGDLKERLESEHEEIHLEIESRLQNQVIIQANKVYFRRAMQNLLVNAFRYAETRVKIIIDQKGEGTVIEVCDDGPGIPPEQRERIFEPFRRIDDSRDRKSGGVGLGLAIVQRIIASHGGSVSVTDNQGKGSCFTTFWPAN